MRPACVACSSPGRSSPACGQFFSAIFFSTSLQHISERYKTIYKIEKLLRRCARLFRLFEYTRVPSRFVNTAFELNPARFDGGNNLTNPNDGRWRFHPPFNHISKYRVPGLLNINTIFTRNIWEAVLDQHGLDQGQYDFDKYAASRRGYGTPTNRMFTLDPNWPTFFGNPFRPPHAAQMVPLDSMEKSEISVTLMRPSGSDANISNLDLLLQDSRTNDHNNTDRNAFFRYQNMQRLGNLVTTRSNVFAIWITVGYFELVPMDDPITGQSKLTLGPELGTDTGDINRYRAFYVVDRSIPVAFQPGKNHNVDRAVLLRRYIE